MKTGAREGVFFCDGNESQNQNREAKLKQKPATKARSLKEAQREP